MPIDLQPSQTLAEAIEAACAEIDAAAERARLAHITGGVGQAMTYQAKAAEARAVLAAGEAADPADYPLVSARAEVANITLAEAAQEIADRATAWQQLGAQIERAREAGKAAARAGDSHAAVGRAASAALSALYGLECSDG